MVYGAGIGVLTWVIRSWGSYPDGVAFSVLLLSAAAAAGWLAALRAVTRDPLRALRIE